jgi:hypothetical protein
VLVHENSKSAPATGSTVLNWEIGTLAGLLMLTSPVP